MIGAIVVSGVNSENETKRTEFVVECGAKGGHVTPVMVCLDDAGMHLGSFENGKGVWK